MVRQEQFSFKSHDGKTMIHGVRWIPEGQVRAVLQICHGMSEYIERYRDFAEYLGERGVLVTGHDHLGHGGSASSGKDYGYFAEKDGNRAVLRDIRSVHKRTKREYPQVPYILFGHSMGSFLARQYLCCFGEELDGAVICGTGFQPKAAVMTGMVIARIEAAFMGWHHRSRLLRWITFGSYNQRFRPNRTDSDWICSDDAVVDAYISDPKCGFSFTVNGYYHMFLGMLKLHNPDYLDRMPRSLPVLFIAGEQDPVGDFGKGVKKAAASFKEMGMEHVECKLYPEARHEILNEKNREEVYQDVWEWMNREVEGLK